MLKQRIHATVTPNTSIGVGPPCRQNRKAPRLGIEPGLQEPKSDADRTAAEPFRDGITVNPETDPNKKQKNRIEMIVLVQ